MPYWPKHRPQLTAIATASVDCGPRSVQMALDDASRGALVPSIRRIRRVMADQDETNRYQWDRAIDIIGGPLEIRARVTHSLAEIADHTRAGMGAIWTVDYGRLRRMAPKRTGSESFDGLHAMYTKGDRDELSSTRSFDSLLDGRYRGCPKGPVWLSWDKLARAAQSVYADDGDTVYAALVYPPDAIVGVPPPPVDSDAALLDELRGLVQQMALALEPGNAEADASTDVSGTEVPT